ncbi:MAG: YeeE/YedE family protein [Pseudomonadota bacterium]
MIGATATAPLLGIGRVMRASGIVGGLVAGSGHDKSSKIAFLVGLIGVPSLMTLAGWQADKHATSLPRPLVPRALSIGSRTRFSTGCTSGHGVRSMSRLSLRGFSATGAHVGADAVTAILLRMGMAR